MSRESQEEEEEEEEEGEGNSIEFGTNNSDVFDSSSMSK
jgi:hypothetical protein